MQTISIFNTAHSLTQQFVPMPSLPRAGASLSSSPPMSTFGAIAVASNDCISLTGEQGSQSTTTPPGHYQDVIAALTAMGTSDCASPSHRSPPDSLSVRPSIAKSRAMPGRATARRMASLVRAQRNPEKRQSQHSLAAVYLDGVRAAASWARISGPSSMPKQTDGAADNLADPVAACGPSCISRLGAINCATLDPSDVEGSMRLRLASIEETFEHQAARRLATSLERIVANGSVRAVAIHRPIWARASCLACAAESALSRPPLMSPSNLERTASLMRSSLSTTTAVLAACDLAENGLSSNNNDPRAATAGMATLIDAPRSNRLDALCVYAGMRGSDGSVVWTARFYRNSSCAGADHPSQHGAGNAADARSFASCLMSSVSTGSPRRKARCARCTNGMRIKGATPTSIPDGAKTMTVDVDEIIGALAANLWEGIAGAVICFSNEPGQKYHTLWSGVPGQRPMLSFLDASAVPLTTWLATETRAIIIDTARRRPPTGGDALYSCARIAYAAARLADVTARQNAIQAFASRMSISDPRRVRSAVPLTYGPAFEAPLPTLAWMCGAAALFGSAVDADKALGEAATSYRMHVLAGDLERTSLSRLDPSSLPDQVRELAHQLWASTPSLSGRDAECGGHVSEMPTTRDSTSDRTVGRRKSPPAAGFAYP